MKRLRFIFLFALLSVAGATAGQRIDADSLRQFDLLFVVNPDGNAITESTTARGQLPIDHVGYYDGGAVMEATTGKGVTRTELADFVRHNRAKDGKAHILVGRIKTKVHLSDRLAKRFSEPIPYDSLYEPDDSAMYCSELVQKALVDKDGKQIFESIPMSFHDATGKILPYWTEFYRKHGRNVPEGEPGTNPGQLARSPQVRIIGWLK